MTSPRVRVRDIAAGRGATVVVPLALHVSARIQERDAEDFLYDATQLANALRDLIDAVDPDGVPVSDPDVLLTDCTAVEQLLGSAQLTASLEATRRLRTSYGDRVALVAMIPGPARLIEAFGVSSEQANDAVLELGKSYLGADVDVVVVHDDHEAAGASLSTLANIARFHQAAAMSHGTDRYGLAGTSVLELEQSSPVDGLTTTRLSLTRETDIGELRDWVDAARG